MTRHNLLKHFMVIRIERVFFFFRDFALEKILLLRGIVLGENHFTIFAGFGLLLFVTAFRASHGFHLAYRESRSSKSFWNTTSLEQLDIINSLASLPKKDLNGASFSNLSIPCLIASSFDSTRRPLLPFWIVFFNPGTFVPMMGIPQDMASINA